MILIRTMLLIWFCIFFMAIRVAIRGIGKLADEDVCKRKKSP
jgi:hypothetical protein